MVGAAVKRRAVDLNAREIYVTLSLSKGGYGGLRTSDNVSSTCGNQDAKHGQGECGRHHEHSGA
jgi:hypothetical protein